MRKYLPNFLKPIIRFVYYKNERKKIFREFQIRKSQNKAIKELYSENESSLIVFLIDGANWFTGTDSISGGIMSISSIYEETLKLEELHKCKSIMVTHKDAHLLLRLTKFPNNIPIFRFNQLFQHFKKLNKIIIHIPDCYFNICIQQLIDKHNWFTHIQDKHVNILNQNILLMPTPSEIAQSYIIASKVTQTTAHDKYTNKQFRDFYKIPLHKLSVFTDCTKYYAKKYKEKENLILFSPDDPLKNKILSSKINFDLPHYQTRTIENLSYSEYLKLISKAKFTITFGEGLDYYFIESVYSGSIAIAIYNEDFFTENFKELTTVYNDFECLKSNIVNFIKTCDNSPINYQATNSQQKSAINAVYDHQVYVNNIKKFYLEEYTYN